MSGRASHLAVFCALCIGIISNATAGVDFSGVAGGGVPIYKGTLTGLYPGTSSINSGFNVTFAASSSGTGFAYTLPNGTTYWFDVASITDNPSRNGGVLAPITSTTAGQDITGYFAGNTVRAVNINSNVNIVRADLYNNKITVTTSGTAGYIYVPFLMNTTVSINHIYGDFINNSVNGIGAGIGSIHGGALALWAANSSYTIGGVTGTFIGNRVTSLNGSAEGGALNIRSAYLYNTAITGDFVMNSASGALASYGGAIFNYELTKIGNISGNFIGNYASGGLASGGAIWNRIVAMGDINGNFNSNYVYSDTDDVRGGAIHASTVPNINNLTEIRSITGNFINNYACSTLSEAAGGAIYHVLERTAPGNNTSTIGNINGDFIRNHADGLTASGGAIYNSAKITGFIGDFSSNYAVGDSLVKGGAVYNELGIIGSIESNFNDNYAISANANAYGGAIYNAGTITSITGDFVGNYSQSNANNVYSYGGAIWNRGAINDLNSNFISNYVVSENGHAEAAAIYNEGTIKNIFGDFIGNYAIAPDIVGGIVNNFWGDTNLIRGNFINNWVQPIGTSSFWGGVIYNTSGTIHAIEADFIGNYSIGSGLGLGIYNSFGSPGPIEIGYIKGDFINNSIYGNGAGSAIYNDGRIGPISGNFIGNKVIGNLSAQDGAIWTYGDIEGIFGNFEDNQVIVATTESISYYRVGRGAILNSANGDRHMHNIVGDFINNSAVDKIVKANALFFREAIGGAIVSYSPLENVTGNFIGNYASSLNGYAFGGALYLYGGSTNLSANGRHTELSDNYVESGLRPKFYNSILINGVNNNELNIKVYNNGSITFNDSIEIARFTVSPGGGSMVPPIYSDPTLGPLNITGDGSGTVYMNDAIIGTAKVSVTNGTLKFGEYDHGDTTFINNISRGAFFPDFDSFVNGGSFTPTATLALNDGTFNINNKYFENVHVEKYSATGNSWLVIDMNIEDSLSDVLHVSGAATGKTKVLIHDLGTNIITEDPRKIMFASSGTGDEEAFKIFAVFANPYMYETLYEADANDPRWYLYIPKKEPEPENPKPPIIPPVRPEVMAYTGMHIATVEQIRSIFPNIRSRHKINLANSQQGLQEKCPAYFNCCESQKYVQPQNDVERGAVWAMPFYESTRSKSILDVDSRIYGAEFGLDLRSRDQKIGYGVFGSVRRGNHALDGIGKHNLRSPVESKIDMNTFAGGAYARSKADRLLLDAYGYGGIAAADVTTSDGLSTSGKGGFVALGFSAGIDAYLNNGFFVHPLISAETRHIKWGTIYDDIGKRAKFDMLNQLEVEGGIKIGKSNGRYQVYVMPSIARTVGYGYSMVYVNGFQWNTYEDLTLGRIEVSAVVPLSSGFSFNARARYGHSIGGPDYQNFLIGVGLNIIF
jgi:outer membrane autotransporter protein